MGDDIVSAALLGKAGDRLAQSMGHWRERELAAGEVLWYESDPVTHDVLQAAPE